jgi:hypothetical protein
VAINCHTQTNINKCILILLSDTTIAVVPCVHVTLLRSCILLVTVHSSLSAIVRHSVQSYNGLDPGRRCGIYMYIVIRCLRVQRNLLPMSSPSLLSPPTLCMFSAASIAKPNAIERLTANLFSYNIDIAVISE